MDVGSSVTIGSSVNIGSANNGLTNYIKASNNVIYGTISNTFDAAVNTFEATNNFTGPSNFSVVATFNSGFKCAKQPTAYNIFMGIATYVSSNEPNGSNTVPPYGGSTVYGDCNATYVLDQSISNVQGMFISPNDTNFSMWYVAMIDTNNVNISCVNLTSDNKTLPTTIGYMCFATV